MTTTAASLGAEKVVQDSHLGRALGLLSAVLVVSIALPLIFLREGPWYHLVFHLLGIAVCVLGVLVLRAVRRAATSKALRVMTWVGTVAFLGWAVGHAGELVTVLTYGGAHAENELFQHPVHMFFANIAAPAWMLTVLSTLVVLVTAGVQALRRRGRR